MFISDRRRRGLKSKCHAAARAQAACRNGSTFAFNALAEMSTICAFAAARIGIQMDHRAIKWLQLLPSLFKIKKDIDLPKQMIGRDMIVETEVVNNCSGEDCLFIIDPSSCSLC